MELVYLGFISNTHGIKGELKIKSDFERKDLVFKKDNSLIINKKDYIIKSYRKHKEYDLVAFYDLEDINLVQNLKGMEVYFEREKLNLKEDEYLYVDLLNKDIVVDDEIIGKSYDYENSTNPLLYVMYNNKKYYIPLKGNFVKKVDLDNKKIYVIDETKELII